MPKGRKGMPSGKKSTKTSRRNKGAGIYHEIGRTKTPVQEDEGLMYE